MSPPPTRRSNTWLVPPRSQSTLLHSRYHRSSLLSTTDPHSHAGPGHQSMNLHRSHRCETSLLPPRHTRGTTHGWQPSALATRSTPPAPAPQRPSRRWIIAPRPARVRPAGPGPRRRTRTAWCGRWRGTPSTSTGRTGSARRAPPSAISWRGCGVDGPHRQHVPHPPLPSSSNPPPPPPTFPLP